MGVTSAAGLAFLLLSGTPEAPPPIDPLPLSASWSALRMEAKKSVFKASLDVAVLRQPAAAALSELREWPDAGARKPVGEVVVFALHSKASFRGEGERTTWADGSGLLQDDGRDGKRKSVRRFGDAALHQWKDRGRGVIEERHVALEQSVPARPVVDFALLLWLATAMRLDREGAGLQVAVVSRGRLMPLDLEAREIATLAGRKGSVTARRILIRSPDEEHETSLFGLRGDVDLWLDTATGMPVELRGIVAKLGPVRVRVVSVTPETSPAP